MELALIEGNDNMIHNEGGSPDGRLSFACV
jgi:hypothetical protein